MASSTETRTYIGLTGTHVFDGFKGLRLGQRYTGVGQEDDSVLVSAVGAPVGTGVVVSREEWGQWFNNPEPAWQPEPHVPMTEENTDWGF